MRVILYRQRKVSGRFATGEIQRIFAAANELDDRQGKVGERLRGGRAATGQETLEGDRSRCRGELFFELGREFDNACPVCGITQDAAEGGKVFLGQVKRRYGIRGDHELLDQLRRPVGLIQFQRGQRVTGKNRLRLERLQTERTVVMAQARELLRDAILQTEVLVQSWDLRNSARSRGGASQPRGDA